MLWGWGERVFSSAGASVGEGFAGGGRAGWLWEIGGIGTYDRRHVGAAIGVTAMLGLALAGTIVLSSHRGSLKSPWSRRKRKHVLTPQQWKKLFTPEGKLCDGGAKLLKKVRSGGVDPSIRSEVWPFLLGVYELNSSEDERNAMRKQKRKEYKKLRKKCQYLLELGYDGDKMLKDIDEVDHRDSPSFSGCHVSPKTEDDECAGHPFSHQHHSPDNGLKDIDEVDHRDSLSSSGCHASPQTEDDECAGHSFSHQHHSPDNGNIEQTFNDEASTFRNGRNTSHMKISLGAIEKSQAAAASDDESDLTSADAIEERGRTSTTHTQESIEAISPYSKTSSLKSNASKSTQTVEDFTTWQRIIRLDAVRANAEWVIHSPAQAAVTEEKAVELAEFVGLKDYDHLEPCMIYHAARLVAVLEAYAIYDPVIGYCQGMSDLLSPIIAIMGEDDEAFWCFVGFMMKARHNFRLDEVGIRRQLSIVSKIIKFKDPHLYKHLEKLQAEDCFFVYRMVVVLFRRELNFEQTLCLWEVMWADQAAIRSGFGKSAWVKIRSHAPPTDDLLLYAIAACVLQRRKLIIERYSSMEEILRECNSMAGNLDVWKLLDDAHDLVVTLHEKIS